MKLSNLPVLCAAIFVLLPAACSPSKNDPYDMKRPIALFTDYGSGEVYLAQLKGSLLSTWPEAMITDLFHDAAAYSVDKASYLLRKTTRHLPLNAIIVAVVDPGVGGNRAPVAIRTQTGRIYIGPDNGLFTHVLLAEGVAEARLLENTQFFNPDGVSKTFHGRDIFAPVAAHLAQGAEFASVGPVVESLTRLPIDRPIVVGDRVTGHIVHVDRFGNVITNFDLTHIPGSHDSLIRVTLRGKTFPMPLLQTYADAPDSRRPFLIFNSDAELEISRKEASAAELFPGLKVGDPVILQK